MNRIIIMAVGIFAIAGVAAGCGVNCCDGTTSPSCKTSQTNMSGCCSGHGGVCQSKPDEDEPAAVGSASQPDEPVASYPEDAGDGGY